MFSRVHIYSLKDVLPAGAWMCWFEQTAEADSAESSPASAVVSSTGTSPVEGRSDGASANATSADETSADDASPDEDALVHARSFPVYTGPSKFFT